MFKTYGQVPFGDMPCLLVSEPDVQAGEWLYIPGGRQWWIYIPIIFGYLHHGTNRDIALMSRAEHTLRLTFDRFLSQNVNMSEFPIDMAILGNAMKDEDTVEDNQTVSAIAFEIQFLTHLSTLHALAG